MIICGRGRVYKKDGICYNENMNFHAARNREETEREPMKLKILSFWGINAPLDAEKLNRQMDEMKKLGLDGVVFHPRFYPGKPAYLSQEYMDIVSEVILHARETGMEFWLYDEDGWPSGTAGGLVMKAHPEFKMMALNDDLTIDEKSGVSAIEKGAVDAFIEITHERYANLLNKEAFDYVTGFFSDEVGFCGMGSASATGKTPWCSDMPEKFRTKALFEDMPGCHEIRVEYWEYLIELMQERFYRPIRRWCEAHGKIYTGHLKGEENPYFAVSYSGSIVSSLKSFDLPGIDALERYIPHSLFTRFPGSQAVQFGDGHAMCEAMAGSGWGTNPQDEENYLLTMAKQGIDTFIMHIQQYELNEKSLTDWPPSRPLDLNWAEVYPEMLKRLRKKAEKIDPWKEADALVVVPARGAMAGFVPEEALPMNDHSGDEMGDAPACRDSLALMAMTDAMTASGWLYDLTDEATYEKEAIVTGKGVRIGRREYTNVLMATGALTTAEAPKATPAQGKWEIVSFDGERKMPAACRKKDDKHFLCTFDGEAMEEKTDAGNLIASGYGFCRSVTLKKGMMLAEDMEESTLMLTGIDGAAAGVSVDGRFVGYAYGPDWSMQVPAMKAGEHEMRVKLINSGFNVRGPHHYYLGDFKLISPVHIKGKKHFGDLPDAPENTHIPEWHFVNFRLFGNVHLLDKPLRKD